MAEMKKPLGFWTLTALVIGNMVGSGIFLLPTTLATTGSIGVIGLVIASVGATLLAYILAKMSQYVPRAGGPYAFAKTKLGDFVGFQTVYNHWFAMWVAIIAVTIELTIFLSIILPTISNTFVNIIFCIAIIWIIAAINLSNIEAIKITQIVTVILKIIPLLLIILVGCFYFHPEYLINNFNLSSGSHLTALSNTTALAVWAFIGLESATIPYNLVENPTRNIPLATLIGTIVAALLYILSSTVILGTFPIQTIMASKFPFAIAAQTMFGNWGTYMVILGAVISCVGSINGWIFIQGQLTKVAAEDGLFPQVFSYTNKNAAPATGILLTAALMTGILILTLSSESKEHLQIVMSMASMAALIPYIYGSISALVVSKDESIIIKNRDTFFAIAFVAALYSLWTIISIGKNAIFYGTILIFVSAIVYGLQFKSFTTPKK